MRILYLGNNWVGWQVLQWLRGGEDEIAGLVLDSERSQRYAPEIRAAGGLPDDRVFSAEDLDDAATLRRIEALRPDIGLSVFFGSLLRPPFLRLLPRGCLNLHPSLLPYNRGAHPNVWAIVEGTPAGVTLHHVDDGVDTGDVVAQREVPVRATDTGETLYRRLERACVGLVRETWPLVRSGAAPRLPQDRARSTCHRVRDLDRIAAIDLDRTYTARELVDILRARTFPPFPGVYVERDGRRVYLRLELLEEDELSGGSA